MPSTFEVSATVISARVAVGDSIGVIVAAANTGVGTISVPVRYPMFNLGCEGHGEVAVLASGDVWGASFSATLRAVPPDSGSDNRHKQAPEGCRVAFGPGEVRTDTVWLDTPGPGSFEAIGSYSWKNATPIRVEVVR